MSTHEITLAEERMLHRRHRNIIPWFSILIILASMFMIEHSLRESIKFNDMMFNSSIDDLLGGKGVLEQNPLRVAGGLLIGIYGLFWIVQRKRSEAPQSGLLGGLMLFFFGWLCLSLAWSMDPRETFRRMALFGLMGLGAYASATRFSIRDVIVMAFVVSGLLVLIGIFAEIRNSTFHPLSPWFRFCGTLHPNKQAVNCSIFFLSSAALLRTEKSKFFFLVMLVIAFVFLYLTKSRTALASTIVALLAWWGLILTNPGKIAVASIGVASVCLLILFAEVVLPAIQQRASLGRTDTEASELYTLTGRTDLWDQLGGYAEEKPVLGYGYGAFWNNENTKAIIEEQGWPITHAHNAYIDLQLAAGPVAVVLFGLIILMGLRLAFVNYKDTGDNGYAFFGVMLVYCVLNGLLESTLVERTFMAFLTIVILAFLAFRQAPAVHPSEEMKEESAA